MGYVMVVPQQGCHPWWRGLDLQSRRENVDPATLPLHAQTAREIADWGAGPSAVGDDDYWALGRLLACRAALELAGRETLAYFDGRLSCLVPLLPADGGVWVDGGRLALPGHWIDLAPEPAEQGLLDQQLFQEIPPGHVLRGRQSTVLARCGVCDDVLLRMADGGYAVVHLTWRQSAEISPDHPSTWLHQDPAGLLADLVDRHL